MPKSFTWCPDLEIAAAYPVFPYTLHLLYPYSYPYLIKISTKQKIVILPKNVEKIQSFGFVTIWIKFQPNKRVKFDI